MSTNLRSAKEQKMEWRVSFARVVAGLVMPASRRATRPAGTRLVNSVTAMETYV
jgi:hypothetical protein